MQEHNKAYLPREVAVCPSDPSVPIGPSLASSLTSADIEAVVQQVLSRTSTALLSPQVNNLGFLILHVVTI